MQRKHWYTNAMYVGSISKRTLNGRDRYQENLNKLYSIIMRLNNTSQLI